MPVTSRTFAVLSAVQYEMQKNPLMVYNEQGSTGAGSRADGKTIDIKGEFGVDRILARMGMVIDETQQTACAGYYASVDGVPAVTVLPSMASMFAFELMGNAFGKIRYAYGADTGGYNYLKGIPLVVRQQGASRANDPTHGEVGEEEAYAWCTGIQVVVPHKVYDCKGMMHSLLRGNRPTFYVDYSSEASADIPDEPYTVPIGKSAILKEGKDLTIATYGPSHPEVAKAVDALAKEGIAAEYLDVRTLKPFDEATLVTSVKKTGRLLTATWAHYTMGFGGWMLACCAQEVPGFKCRMISWPDCPNPGTPEMIAWLKPTSDKIADAARKLMKL